MGFRSGQVAGRGGCRAVLVISVLKIRANRYWREIFRCQRPPVQATWSWFRPPGRPLRCVRARRPSGGAVREVQGDVAGLVEALGWRRGVPLVRRPQPLPDAGRRSAPGEDGAAPRVNGEFLKRFPNPCALGDADPKQIESMFNLGQMPRNTASAFQRSHQGEVRC